MKAITTEGEFNEFGMPIKWQDFKFSWNKDLYLKKITIKQKGQKKILLDVGAMNPALPPRIAEALKQLAYGASVYRDEDEATPEVFIQKHGITDKNFDQAMNRKITQKYGIGFASKIYQELLMKKAGNKEFKELVHDQLDQVKNKIDSSITFVIARGYAHTVMGNDLFRYLKEDLGIMGYEVVMAETDAFGYLEENEKVMLDVFQEQIARNRRVVLIGTCVGLVASLGALEKIKKESGKIPLAGLINIAGMLKGSFVVDWGTRMPQWFFIKRGLFKEYKTKGGAPAKFSKMEAMKDFRFERIGNFMKNVGHVGELSEKTLNLVSILPDSGLGRAKSGIRRMQDEVIRPNIKKTNYGANDGIIEYPDTVLDEKLSQKNVSLIFESSHNFLDGYYDSFGKRIDLRKDEERLVIMQTVVQSFLSV